MGLCFYRCVCSPWHSSSLPDLAVGKSYMKHLGFTGTRNELSLAQHKKLVLVLELCWQQEYRILHHGDCVGADASAHKLAWAMGYEIIIHPPTDGRLRAYCLKGKVLEPKPYLDRNKDIVDQSSLLIACPQQRQEITRSGTWSTVRYARKRRKEVQIVWP